MLEKNELFDKICLSSLYGNLGLFVGAGFSKALFTGDYPQTQNPLSWIELLKAASEYVQIEWKDDDSKKFKSCPEIASEICKKISLDKKISFEESSLLLKEKISLITNWYPSKKTVEKYSDIIKNLRAKWIITTNYDLVLECLLKDGYISLGSDAIFPSSDLVIPIFHLHGIRTIPKSIVITNEDYIKLFRPNEYRLEKLATLFTESTTLVIGYGLGDSNVLTALDWARNVYSKGKENFPHNIIQLLYTEKKDNDGKIEEKDGVVIYQTSDLLETLKAISDYITNFILKDSERKENLKKIANLLSMPDSELIEKFINDKTERKKIISKVNDYHFELTGVFDTFLSKIFDKCWKMAMPKNAFYAYEKMISIILDLFIQIPFENTGANLFRSIAGHLSSVSSYIGEYCGQSWKAAEKWKNEKDKIPEQTMNELKNYALKNDSRLFCFLDV